MITAPQIPEHRFLNVIDEGGFATVYKYERNSLGRAVAIKVMRMDMFAGLSADEFRSEARIMASLSGHPNIVTIHDFGTLADGRPYLVMEYCPPPNLKVRAETQRLPVTFVLDVGIRIAGAVETAHRAGVLHRDIKPANILMAGFGPKLTDFGIAELRGGERGADGVSVPWASLEAVQGSAVDERADVHSLGATLYSLLTGRWPFEQPGGANEMADLMARMASGAAQPIGRADVPVRLEQAIRRAMSPDPAQRPQSALEFAHELRGLAPAGWNAPEPLMPEETTRAAMELTQSTQRRHAAARAWSPAQRGAQMTGPAVVHTGSPGAMVFPAAPVITAPGTLPRSRASVHSGPGTADATRARVVPVPPPPPKSGRRSLVIGGSVAAACALLTAGFLMFGPSSAPDPAPETTTAFNPMPPDVGQPGPATWQRRSSQAVLSWGQSDRQPGDSYQWRRFDAGGQPIGKAVPTSDTSVTISAKRGERVCIRVWVVRGDDLSTDPLKTCNPEAQ